MSSLWRPMSLNGSLIFSLSGRIVARPPSESRNVKRDPENPMRFLLPEELTIQQMTCPVFGKNLKGLLAGAIARDPHGALRVDVRIPCHALPVLEFDRGDK